MSEVISILSFSWNANSTRICETLDPNLAIQNRVGLFPNKRQECTIFDVWSTLADKINEKTPTIVVLSFQEEPRTGSYAFTELFPTEMPKLGYYLFKNVENTTLITGDSLRLAVYLREDVNGQIIERYPPEKFSNLIFGDYKAVAIYLSWLVPGINQYETLTILNLHGPFDKDNMEETFKHKNINLRQKGLNKQNEFITEAIDKLVYSKPTNHVILMGDLNYRMNPFDSWSATQAGIYYLENARDPDDYPETLRQQDELSLQRDQGLLPILLDFEEGVGQVKFAMQKGIRQAQSLVKAGPLFEPTCTMALTPDRPSIEPNIRAYDIGGRADNQVPSHCERILHASPMEGPRLKALEYDRLDGGVMTKSGHAAIYSLHTFE